MKIYYILSFLFIFFLISCSVGFHEDEYDEEVTYSIQSSTDIDIEYVEDGVFHKTSSSGNWTYTCNTKLAVLKCCSKASENNDTLTYTYLYEPSAIKDLERPIDYDTIEPRLWEIFLSGWDESIYGLIKRIYYGPDWINNSITHNRYIEYYDDSNDTPVIITVKYQGKTYTRSDLPYSVVYVFSEEYGHQSINSIPD